MITYVDSSVLLARYLSEERAREATLLLRQSEGLVASRIAAIEVKRGLRFISSPVERVTAQSTFAHEWRSLTVVEIDASLADLAARIAAETGVRCLDSIHVASAVVTSADRFMTLDHRQAETARAYALAVVGVS